MCFGQVTWIIADSHRSEECPLVGVAMSERRWRDFLQRGFFPCVPCSGVAFARIQVSALEAGHSSFDVLLHKVGTAATRGPVLKSVRIRQDCEHVCFTNAQASDFLEGIDNAGAPVIPEALAALLRAADGAHGHPVCLDNPQSLAKVGWSAALTC